MEIILTKGHRTIMLEPFISEKQFFRYIDEFCKRCDMKKLHPSDKRELKRITDNLFETL